MTKKENKPRKKRLSLEEMSKKINKKYGEGSISRASESAAFMLERLPSGIYGIDKLTEGGFPLGRIVQIYGRESGGKTSTMLKTIANAQRYCSRCLKVQPDKKVYDNEPTCECDEPKDMQTVFLDVEGSYDSAWAESIGVNDELVWGIRPKYAEQGLDVLDGAVRDSEANIVVVDTITMLSPKKEQENSAEDDTVALRARKINQALRKLVSAQNDEGMLAQRKLVIFLICQINMDIGGFYTSETKTGGKTKEFVNSFELRFAKSEDGKLNVGRISTCECQVKKSKISSTRGDKAKFNIITRSTKQFKKGEFDETASLFNDMKDLGIIFKNGKEWAVDPRSGISFPDGFTRQKDVKKHLIDDREHYEVLKRFTLDYLFGSIDDKDDDEED